MCMFQRYKFPARVNIKVSIYLYASKVPVAASSLNKSDCFILDLGKNHSILVLMPPGARRMEKFKANQVANEIRDEDHAGNAEIKLIGKMILRRRRNS